MHLLLRRNTFNTDSTLGELYIDGKLFCFTLEDVVRPDGFKVYGKTAIRAGEYPIEMTFSPKYQKIMPLICNVPGFDGVRIHSGNTDADTEGCVLVGYVKGTNTISRSKAAFSALYDILAEGCSKGDVTLRIVNNDR